MGRQASRLLWSQVETKAVLFFNDGYSNGGTSWRRGKTRAQLVRPTSLMSSCFVQELRPAQTTAEMGYLNQT